MNMEQVESSAVKAIGYDEGTRTARVEFKKGATYDYDNVPPDSYARLKEAKSIGGELRNFTAIFKGRKVS